MNSPRVIQNLQSGHGKNYLKKACEKNSVTPQTDQQKPNNPNTASIQDLIQEVNEVDMNTPNKGEGDTNDHSFFDSKLKSETEEKIKELTEQNAKLENECLKFQRQLKSMEVKIQETNEKNYKSTTNTSSKFILPSEVKQMWDSIAQEHLVDTFIDFFENQKLAYYLVSEFFYVNVEVFRSVFHLKIKRIFEQLKIPFGQNTLVSVIKLFRPIIEEFFENIFYDPEEEDSYVNNIKNVLLKRLKSQMEIDESKISDILDCLESRYFKEFVSIMKKLILYCEMHEPPLKFDISSIKERKPTIKYFKVTEIICADGLPKENKKCLMMIAPPLLKSYYYMGLKPIVVVYTEGLEEFEKDDECKPQAMIEEEEEEEEERSSALLLTSADLSPSKNPLGLTLNKESSIKFEDKEHLIFSPLNEQVEVKYSPDLRSKHELLKQAKSNIRPELTFSTPNFKKEESKITSKNIPLEKEEKEVLPQANLYYSTANLNPTVISKELSNIKERIFEKIIEKDSSRNIKSIPKYNSNKGSQSYFQMAYNSNSINHSSKLVDGHSQVKSDYDKRSSIPNEDAKRLKESNKCQVHSATSAALYSSNKKSRQKIIYPNCLNGFNESKTNKTAVSNNCNQMQNRELDFGIFCTGQSNINCNFNHNTMDIPGEDTRTHLLCKKEASKSESLDLRDFKGGNNSYKATSNSQQQNAKNIKLNQPPDKKTNSNSSTPNNTVFFSNNQNQVVQAQPNQTQVTNFVKSLVTQPPRTKESLISGAINSSSLKGNAELRSSINSKTINDNSLNKTHSYNKNSQSNSSNSNIVLQSNQTGIENRTNVATSEIIDDISLQIKKRQTSIDNPKLAGFLNSNPTLPKDDQDAVKVSLIDYQIKNNDVFYSTLVTPKSRGNKQSHFKMQVEGKEVANNKNMDILMSNTINDKAQMVNSFKKNFSSSLKNKPSNKNEFNDKSSPLNQQAAPATEPKKISIISTTITSSLSPGPTASVSQTQVKQSAPGIQSGISPKSSSNLFSNMKKSKTKNYFESNNEIFVNATLQTSSTLSNNPSSNHRNNSTSNPDPVKGKVVNPDLYKLIEVNYCNQISNGIRKEAKLSNMNSKSKSDFRSTSHHNLLYGGNKREINNSCELDSNNNYIYQEHKNPGAFISQAKNRKIIENLIHSSRSKALKLEKEDCNDLPECSDIPLNTEIVERKKNLNLNSSFEVSFSKMKKEENLTEVNNDSETKRKGSKGTREICASNSNFVASKQDLKSENRSPYRMLDDERNELNYIDCETINCKNEMYILGDYRNTKLSFHEKKRSEGSHMQFAQPVIDKSGKTNKKDSFLSTANNYSSNQTKSKLKQPSAYKILGYPSTNNQLQSKTFKNFEPKHRKEEKVVVNLASTHAHNLQVQVQSDFAASTSFKPAISNFQASNARKLSHSRRKINSSVVKVNEQLTDQNRMSKPQSKGKISTFQGETIAIKKQTTKIIHSIKNSKNKFPTKKSENNNSALMHDNQGQVQYSYREPHSEAPSSNQTIDKSEFAKNTQDLNFNKDLKDDNDFEFLIKESLGTFNSGMKRPQSKTPKQQRAIEQVNSTITTTNQNFNYKISPQQESSPNTITINNYINRDKLANKHNVNLKRFPSQSKETMPSEHKFSIQKIKAKADTKVLSEIRKVCSSLSKEKSSPTVNTSSDQSKALFTLKTSPKKNSKFELNSSSQGNPINYHYHDTAPLQFDSVKQVVQSSQAAYMHNLQSNQNIRKASLNTSIINNSNSTTNQQQSKQDSNKILSGIQQGSSENSSTNCSGNIKKYIGASASLGGSIKVASGIQMGGQLPNSSKEVGNLKGSSLIQQSDLTKVKPGIFSDAANVGNSNIIKVISKNDSKGRISPNYFLKK